MMWLLFALIHFVSGLCPSHVAKLEPKCLTSVQRRTLLSSDFLENDLVAVRGEERESPRLCAVKPDGSVAPLCQKEDDVETDLFVDPREFFVSFWSEDVIDSDVTKVYGEGYYGQRPVPSLGGGPGYGAEADDVWSVPESILDEVRNDGVDLPRLDMGIAHGEKSRAGFF